MLRKHDIITEDFIREQYIVLGKSFAEIGKEIGCSRVNLQYWANKFNIPLRKSGRKLLDVSGMRSGKLLVLQKLESDGRHVLWECRCDCGATTKAGATEIIRKTRQCCWDCRNKDIAIRSWKGCGELTGKYFSSIRCAARKRNFEFNITIEETWNLFIRQEQKCSLTGVPIGFGNNQTASLDRIDSLKGYTSDNIQWVHKRVNQMKNDMPLTELKEWCKLILGR